MTVVLLHPTFDIVPEMQHVMTKAVGAMPESDAAVERIGTFIRRHLSVQCAR